MFVDEYYSRSGDSFLFSRKQGSDFAKGIAGDFNPLHEPTNSRFCVPGDLLFALTLAEFGISQSMTFDFEGMVGGNVEVHFTESETGLAIVDEKEKRYLTVTRNGDLTRQESIVESLIRAYVAFSGETFPGILVRLMKQEGVMVNPERPMVIYEQMHIEFLHFNADKIDVCLKDSRFDVNGKRGQVVLQFDLVSNGEKIGCGEKRIIMGGLRDYQQSGIDQLVDNDNLRRDAFFNQS